MKPALVTIVLVFLGVCANPAAANERPLVFTDITIIDATGSPARPHMMVTIGSGKIAAIRSFNQARVPKAAEVVDGRGKFLIPGLWDMHVHLNYGPGYLPLFIANGVTGVREMLGFPPHHEWRKQVQNGSLVGPRMVIAGFFAVTENDSEKARRAIRDAKSQGADFIKVIKVPSREVYFAVANEAKKQDIPFVGHVPVQVRLTEASDAGQKSVEHLTGLTFEASTREEQVRKKCAGLNANEEDCAAFTEAALTFDPEKAAEIYRHLARNHTWQVPTLTLHHNYAFISDPNIVSDSRLKYIPRGPCRASDPYCSNPATRSGWNSRRDALMKPQAAAHWEEAAKQTEQATLKIVRDMHRAGIPLLAGTDTPNPFLVPGFSLHDELALLVEAGLTPMEALQAATRNPAQFFGTLNTSGTIEKGKTADLVLLDANPLMDIRNTEKISGVMLAGRYFDRPALDKMLADVESLANLK